MHVAPAEDGGRGEVERDVHDGFVRQAHLVELRAIGELAGVVELGGHDARCRAIPVDSAVRGKSAKVGVIQPAQHGSRARAAHASSPSSKRHHDARCDDVPGQARLRSDQIARALRVLGLMTEVDLLADLRRDVGTDERDGHVEGPLEHLEQRAVAGSSAPSTIGRHTPTDRRPSAWRLRAVAPSRPRSCRRASPCAPARSRR